MQENEVIKAVLIEQGRKLDDCIKQVERLQKMMFMQKSLSSNYTSYIDYQTGVNNVNNR